MSDLRKVKKKISTLRLMYKNRPWKVNVKRELVHAVHHHSN